MFSSSSFKKEASESVCLTQPVREEIFRQIEASC